MHACHHFMTDFFPAYYIKDIIRHQIIGVERDKGSASAEASDNRNSNNQASSEGLPVAGENDL